MGRSPSRSSDGKNSDQNDRPEVRLLKAIEKRENDKAIAVIEEAKLKNQPLDHLLRIGIARAVEQENIHVAEYLLTNGARPDGAAGARVSPLLKAVERKHVTVVRLLLKHGGNVDVADKQGRTALMMAAWKNHWHILNELLRNGADVNKKDNEGRNVLHNLAADKHPDWGRDVVDLLLRQNIAVDGPDGQDKSRRSPLHWAAAEGKKELCEMLLTRPRAPRAEINAVESKGKTSLHLAVAHGRDDIVELLVHYGADIRLRSDGGWTVLHNACKQGSIKIVTHLLAAGADVNARLLNGRTPLHEAAQAGHVQVVKCLLAIKDCRRAARDTEGNTPFICAAIEKNREMVSILAPFNNVDALSMDALGACRGFEATIVDFGNYRNGNKVDRRSVYEILYGRDTTNPERPKPVYNTLPKNAPATDFRWIHLPANNMTWVEALLTKTFVEEGASDVAGFMALERSFTHQHRGQQVHSQFMRPLSQSTPRAPKVHDDSEISDSADQGPPLIVVHGGSGLGLDMSASTQEQALPHPPRAPARTGTVSTDQTDWTVGSGAGKESKAAQKGKDRHKKSAKWSGSRPAGGKGGATDTPTRPDHHQRRQSSKTLTESGFLRSPGSPGRKDPTTAAKGNVFTFMPYLHFESDTRRQEMQDAIDRAQRLREGEKYDGRIAMPPIRRKMTHDEMLLRAHLTSSTVSLHVRRTLDQSYYHNIDTQSRDRDQVVYRYQRERMSPEEGCVDPKIFMVDQLWMWVLGKDLVVTAFPQRWQQPKDDPLNVLDGIIEDINSKARERVRSVFDLAMIVTARCSGVFSRHHTGDEDYQFLDMFESSIGNATEKETVLFKQFNTASRQASIWLQHHRRPNRFSRHLEAEGRQIEHKNRRGVHAHDHRHALTDPPTEESHFHDDDLGPAHAPLFVDKLLDIGEETKLLAEAKDISDELHMIKKVLEDQRSVLPDLEESITSIYREERKENKAQHELKRRFKEQIKTIDTHIKDLERMDKQAERIYKSITDLLDLKQKHANAFEARFARDQAAGTARQSQTIMVFTIVTIIFLPLSFIAALFTINIREYPHDNGQPSLPLAYVSKYMFGAGFAISIPLIAIAVSLDAIADFFHEAKRRFVLLCWGRHRHASSQQQQQPPRVEVRDDKLDIEYSVDMLAMERALSVGVSTGRGRHSVESYLRGGGGSLTLLPVTSRGTRGDRSPGKGENRSATNGGVGGGAIGIGIRSGNGPVEPVERVTTGFRMRTSGDVERGGD